MQLADPDGPPSQVHIVPSKKFSWTRNLPTLEQFCLQ